MQIKDMEIGDHWREPISGKPLRIVYRYREYHGMITFITEDGIQRTLPLDAPMLVRQWPLPKS